MVQKGAEKMKKQSFLLACLVPASPVIARGNQALVDLVKEVKPAIVLIQTFDVNSQPIGQPVADGL
jgi:hypothetical protein